MVDGERETYAAIISGGIAISLFGTTWLSTSVCMPLGWAILGPMALLFVPALAIVTAISRRLGVNIEVKKQ